MKAAVLQQYGTPTFGEFEEPVAGAGESVIIVRSAAISRFDIAFAEGEHYLKLVLPCVAGHEGVGQLLDGRRMYFDQTIPPFGSMAQKVLVKSDGLIPVPDGVDDAVAAVLGNSGLAAWLPLSWRAQLAPGETVLILGAGIVGRLAVQAAKLLGARHVVIADRDVHALGEAQNIGADAVVPLASDQDPAQSLRTVLGDTRVDVIVDYLWGQPATAALEFAADGARLVQIGTVAGEDIRISASTLRSRLLAILGFASYHAPFEIRKAVYQQMAELARDGVLHIEVDRMPLSQVTKHPCPCGAQDYHENVL